MFQTRGSYSDHVFLEHLILPLTLYTTTVSQQEHWMSKQCPIFYVGNNVETITDGNTSLRTLNAQHCDIDKWPPHHCTHRHQCDTPPSLPGRQRQPINAMDGTMTAELHQTTVDCHFDWKDGQPLPREPGKAATRLR